MTNEKTKRCPYCSEEILVTAIKCKHCGSMLTSGDQSTQKITSETKIKLALSDRYEIIRQIGKGGMATVYEAIQKNLNRKVALKVIHLNLIHDEEFLSRFHREAQISASLDHPNIVTVYDEGQAGDVHYMAMQYLEGKDLHTIIREKGRLGEEETIRYVVPIAEALDYAHKKGVIHRDIKSGNIIITKEGRPILTDFGIAHAASGTKLTQTGVIIGTPEYMSPEQAEGKEIDGRSDLYSLGVVMYECLAGDVPFKGDNPITVIRKILDTEARSMREIQINIPENIDFIVKQLLKKNPELRTQAGEEIRKLLKGENVLKKLVKTEKTKKIITPKVKKKSLPKEKRKPKKKKVILFSSIVLVIITVSITVYLFIEHKQKQVKIEELFSKATYHLEREEFVGPNSNNATFYIDEIIRYDPNNERAMEIKSKMPKMIKDINDKKNKKLMLEANLLFEKGDIVKPEGNNASKKIDQILSIDQGNASAQLLKDKFVDKLKILSKKAFEKKDYRQALYFTGQGLELKINDDELLGWYTYSKGKLMSDLEFSNELKEFDLFWKKFKQLIIDNQKELVLDLIIFPLRRIGSNRHLSPYEIMKNFNVIFPINEINSDVSIYYSKPNDFRTFQEIEPYPLGVYIVILNEPIWIQKIKNNFYITRIGSEPL